jgi:hypothetical protein
VTALWSRRRASSRWASSAPAAPAGSTYLPIVFYGVADGAGLERRGDARQRQSGPRQWEQLLPCAVAEAWRMERLVPRERAAMVRRRRLNGPIPHTWRFRT